MSREDGLDEREGAVMDHLLHAWQDFCLLERQHPDELRDFTDAIHRLQDLLAVRVCRRLYPRGWPLKPPQAVSLIPDPDQVPQWGRDDWRGWARRARAEGQSCMLAVDRERKTRP